MVACSNKSWWYNGSNSKRNDPS